MADKIKGLTIEISADTTNLSQALSEVNKQIKSTGSQLKEVNNLLKLDPTNVELLRQKTELLSKQTDQETKRLGLLNQKLAEMKASGVSETSEQFQKLKRQIEKSNIAIKKNNDELGTKGKKAKKEATKTNKDVEKSYVKMGAKIAIVAGIIIGATKTLAEWALDGAKSANINEETYDNLANSLEKFEESFKQMKDSAGSVIAPILEQFSNLGSEVADKITKSIKQGDGIEGIAEAVLEGLQDILNKIFEYLNNVDYTSAIQHILSIVLNALETLLPTITTGLDNLLSNLGTEIVDAIFTGEFWIKVGKIGVNLGASIVNGLIGTLNGGVNTIIEILNKALGWAGVNIPKIAIPQIPMLAKGGLLQSGSAIVGEAGPELLTATAGGAVVQPLTNNTTNNYYSGADGDITINFTGNLSELARVLEPHISRQQRNVGGSLLQ